MSPPATEEAGPMGHENESRQGIGWYFLNLKINQALQYVNRRIWRAERGPLPSACVFVLAFVGYPERRTPQVGQGLVDEILGVLGHVQHLDLHLLERGAKIIPS
jgi:hypothetical protein